MQNNVSLTKFENYHNHDHKYQGLVPEYLVQVMLCPNHTPKQTSFVMSCFGTFNYYEFFLSRQAYCRTNSTIMI